jgi:hypothetical protein
MWGKYTDSVIFGFWVLVSNSGVDFYISTQILALVLPKNGNPRILINDEHWFLGLCIMDQFAYSNYA